MATASEPGTFERRELDARRANDLHFVPHVAMESAAIARCEAASKAGDIDALMRTLTPDAELVSPIVASFVIRGQKDLHILLDAVYGTIHDLSWGARIGDDDRVVMFAEAKIGPLRIGDAVLVDLAPMDQ